MKKLIALLALMAATSCYAQTAKVIALSPEDVKTAKALDAEQHALDRRREAFNDHVRELYLAKESKQTSGLYQYKEGWPHGEFTFSEKFLYIVPSINEKSLPYWNGVACGTNTYAIPAVGTVY